MEQIQEHRGACPFCPLARSAVSSSRSCPSFGYPPCPCLPSAVLLSFLCLRLRYALSATSR
eukprot:4716340-Pyramimonas_sp.AAC.1